MHPSLEYALVGSIAAAIALLATPLARVLAMKWGALAKVRDRDVHAVETPRLGGVAMLVGFAVSMLVAHDLPTLRLAFGGESEIGGVVVGAAFISVLGMLDDRYELDALTKFAGQVTAAGLMCMIGHIQLAFLYVPWGRTTITLDRDTGVLMAVLLTVLTVNAINFIDGLDGLAAGVTAIEGAAFFAYSYHLASTGFGDIAATPTLLCAGLVGACLGFLPHNFAPARIFMGDSGSMLVGLLLSAAAVTASTHVDPQSQGAVGALPLVLPLLLPLLVLALPLGDLALAVTRRMRRGQSPFKPDKEHLHHRLMQLGHSHRRAVLLLYFWSAVVAFGAVGMAVSNGPWLVAAVVCGLLAAGLLITAVPRLRSLRP